MAVGNQSSSAAASVVRVAAVGDLHCTRSSHGAFQALFSQVSASADMLLLAGDLTDTGLPDEARILAREVAALHVPAIAVFGNHDHESSHQEEVRHILTDAGMTILDGEATEVRGIGVAGVKGFCGGFGNRALGPWGETAIKQFVHEAVNEALKLEASLARLRTKHQIVLLHYSPIQETVEGEPPEIFAFVGSSRLEEPISRFPVSMVFHGHAHRGRPEGHTKDHVPVYNVSLPLLTRLYPDRPHFRVFQIPVDATESAPAAMHGGL
jgi:Icc-related predicted phosphoesterase